MSTRHPAEHVLIAGDLDDLPAIEHLLGRLAENSYGQVFIETLGARRELRAPGRVTVNWLERTGRPSQIKPLVFAARGEALATAVAGWVAEWMPGDPANGSTALMWIGCTASEHMSALYEHLCAELHNLSLLPEDPAR